MLVCARLSEARVAVTCRPEPAANAGERRAAFTLDDEAMTTGVVRTFEAVDACARAGGDEDAGEGGHWLARCDARTAIMLPARATPKTTLAARRVAATL